MCTKILHNAKLIRTKTDLYVLTIKDVDCDTGKIISICHKTSWELNKIIKDWKFNLVDLKRKLDKRRSFYDGEIRGGMFHVAPYSVESFNALKNSIKEEFINTYGKKVYLAVIPKGAYIVRGKNTRCSFHLNDEASICTSELKLIRVIKRLNKKLLNQQY